MQKITDDLIKELSYSLKKDAEKCKSLEDLVDLTFNFKFAEYTITPLQIREEIHALIKILKKLNPKRLIEIGTSNGGTLFLLCKIANPNATIISIDMPGGNFGGELYPDWKKSFYESFASKNQKLHLLRSDSQDINTLTNVKNILENNKVDFLLIDADHNYDGVKKDFEMYSSLVADGGIIAFHDVNHGSKENVGDVPIFWNQIKTRFRNFEIIENSEKEAYGLGLIFMLYESSQLSSTLYEVLLEIMSDHLRRKSEHMKSFMLKMQENPIGLLLSIYMQRADLQQAFPDVLNGNITTLVEWAVEVCKNEFAGEREAKNQLLKFLTQFEEYKNVIIQNQTIQEKISSFQTEIANYKSTIPVLEKEIANYKSTIPVLEKEIANYKSTIPVLEKEIANYKSTIPVLEKEIANYKSTIPVLEKEIANYKSKTSSMEQEVRIHKDEIKNNNNLIKNQTEELENLRRELSGIKSGVGYKIARFCGSKIDGLAGKKSKINQTKKVISASSQVIKNEGLGAYVNHTKTKLKRREFTIIEPQLYKNEENDKITKGKDPTVAKLESISLAKKGNYEKKYRVSVVIPTNKDAASIDFTINRIYEQEGLRDLEVILVNSGSHQLVSLYKKPNFKVIEIDPKNFNHGESRNLGATNSTQDYVIFLTDDAIPVTNHLFYDLCKAIENDPKIAVSTGRQIPRSDSDLMYPYIIKGHYGYLGLSKDRISHTDNYEQLSSNEKRRIVQIDDVCSCYRRSIFLKYKFRKIPYAEDLDIGIRLVKDGYKIAQLYSTGVIHSHDRPPSYYFKRGSVDIITLSSLLEQTISDFESQGISNILDLVSDGMKLYNALGCTIDYLKINSTNNISAIFEEIREKLPQYFSSSKKSKSHDKSLQVIFDKLLVNPTNSKNKSYLMDQYLASLKNFEHFMKTTFPNTKNIENQFFETLYKIYADVLGNVVGSYLLYAKKNGLQDKSIYKIEKVLEGGV